MSQTYLNQGDFFQYSQLYEARKVDYFCDKVPRAGLTEVRYIPTASGVVPDPLRAYVTYGRRLVAGRPATRLLPPADAARKIKRRVSKVVFERLPESLQ